MTTYRRYSASFPFEARDGSELSLQPGDSLIVSKTPAGTWPDPSRWMKGQNENTGQSGEFPGTYVELVEEFTIQDTLEEPEPPPQLPVTPPLRPTASTASRPSVSSPVQPAVSHPPVQPSPQSGADVPPPVPRRVQSASGTTKSILFVHTVQYPMPAPCVHLYGVLLIIGRCALHWLAVVK